MKEKCEAKDIFVHIIPPSAVARSIGADHQILNVTRKGPKQKYGTITIQVPDELIDGIMDMQINFFSHIPIRALTLSWDQVTQIKDEAPAPQEPV